MYGLKTRDSPRKYRSSDYAEDHLWRWDDGHDFNYTYVPPLHTEAAFRVENDGWAHEESHHLTMSRLGTADYGWSRRSDSRSMFCAAPSLASFRGSIPTIINLAAAPSKVVSESAHCCAEVVGSEFHVSDHG